MRCPNADTGTIATGSLLRLRHAAGVGGGRRRAGPADQADRHVRAQESVLRRHGGRRACHSRGGKALRIDRAYASMDQPQDWLGYDFLKADLYTERTKPLDLYVEIRDAATRDYWTRVNYSTVVPAGQSTLVIPIKQLYVGEKSRPGRMLDLGQHHPTGLRHRRRSRRLRSSWTTCGSSAMTSPSRRDFEELHAFDFGTSTSPVMEAFTPITPSTLYSQGRGYGLKDARIWRAFDALQPDPLYQDFLCIEAGGLAVDLPNGRYRVFVNIDSPSGFWGEYQTYRKRAILAEGRPVVSETHGFRGLPQKYFRFWNVEDRPGDSTFDKYQKAYFHEKQFDVDVTDGQLNLEFQGENWAARVSAVVIFPVAEAAQGRRVPRLRGSQATVLLRQLLQARLARSQPAIRSTHPTKIGAGVSCSSTAISCGTSPTTTRPSRPKRGDALRGEAFAGEYEPVTAGIAFRSTTWARSRSASATWQGRGGTHLLPARSTSVSSPTASAG